MALTPQGQPEYPAPAFRIDAGDERINKWGSVVGPVHFFGVDVSDLLPWVVAEVRERGGYHNYNGVLYYRMGDDLVVVHNDPQGKIMEEKMGHKLPPVQSFRRLNEGRYAAPPYDFSRP